MSEHPLLWVFVAAAWVLSLYAVFLRGASAGMEAAQARQRAAAMDRFR